MLLHRAELLEDLSHDFTFFRTLFDGTKQGEEDGVEILSLFGG